MLKQVSPWKHVSILILVLLSAVYAAPNLYPDDPAIQISPYHNSQKIVDANAQAAKQALKEANITIKKEEIDKKGRLLFRLAKKDDQLRAQQVIQVALGSDFIVALNLAPTTPEWLMSFGAQAMKLGLDLSGGVHFLMEVDLKEAIHKRLTVMEGDVKLQLREDKLRYTKTEVVTNGLVLTFADEKTRDTVHQKMVVRFPQFELVNERLGNEHILKMNLLPPQVKEIEDGAITQNLTTMRNRVNELGVSEPLVQRQGRNRIVIELPGVQDTAYAKNLLGKTANLEFRLGADANSTPALTEEFSYRGNPNQKDRLEKTVIVTGDSVSDAKANMNQDGQPQVQISLDSRGGMSMYRFTKDNVGRPMGILFIEQRNIAEYKHVDGKNVIVYQQRDEKSLISVATIQAVLSNNFVITGLDFNSASELALLLRAGSLAAPMYFVEERTIGPSAGADNIAKGTKSSIIAALLVMGFMAIVYRVFGLMANIALAINVLLLIAALSIISATLTLPGIAGIVLTMGMAVDANILIFSRMKEELSNGAGSGAAVRAGFDRAFVTILDSNLTTLIVGLILFAIGTGPVKGFALTLSIGIATSMFTAITVTRSLIDIVASERKLSKIML
jgi:preprotein translocase subunit SecD